MDNKTVTERCDELIDNIVSEIEAVFEDRRKDERAKRHPEEYLKFLGDAASIILSMKTAGVLSNPAIFSSGFGGKKEEESK